MIKSTLGAPRGGTTRGGHHAFDCCAVSPITPPNFGSDAGNCRPSIVAVALGAPNCPLITLSPPPLEASPPEGGSTPDDGYCAVHPTAKVISAALAHLTVYFTFRFMLCSPYVEESLLFYGSQS
jgi:hypothetical protein